MWPSLGLKKMYHKGRRHTRHLVAPECPISIKVYFSTSMKYETILTEVNGIVLEATLQYCSNLLEMRLFAAPPATGLERFHRVVVVR